MVFEGAHFKAGSLEFSPMVFSPVPVLYCDSSWHILHSRGGEGEREGRVKVREGERAT